MSHIAAAGPSYSEQFEVLHQECRPGDRVQDVFAHQVIMHMDDVDGVSAPSKAERDALNRWVRDLLVPLVGRLERDPTCALVFTDGSQKRLQTCPRDAL